MATSSKKQRPKWQTLGWFQPRSYWSIQYRGKRYYFKGDGSGRQTRKSHDEALAEWVAVKQRIDAMASTKRPEYLNAAEKFDAFADLMSQYAMTEPERQQANQWRGRANELRKLADKPKAPRLRPMDANPIYGISEAGQWVWNDRQRRQDNRRKQVGETVAEHVADFLKRKKAQAEGGTRTMDRADALRCYIARFSKWFGENRNIADIDAIALEQYHTHLMGQELSDAYKRDCMQATKQFIRNRAHLSALPLPPNIDSPDLRFAVAAKAVEPMPVDDLKRLLSESSDRTRLYFLLMINCGMGKMDIAELRRDEIDLRARTITRQRSKTRKRYDSAPIIVYALWPSTLDLLKEHIAEDGDLALVNENDEPLIRKSWRKDGKMHKTDNIQSAVHRVYLKLKEDGEPVKQSPKFIRKTGATLIGGEFGDSLVYEYLGDVPSGMAARHYVKPNAEKFAAALSWLGEQVGEIEGEDERAAA